jgi:hypothetical protein
LGDDFDVDKEKILEDIAPAMRGQTSNKMLKVPAKLYRIGDLVRYTPFSRQTIHNYTTMGLIREAEWTQGGHRLYDETVFSRLSRIMQLRKTKSLFEIQEIISRKKSRRRDVHHN